MENRDEANHPLVSGLKNKSIETYAEDMAKVIQGNQGELIKNMIHEQEMHELEKKNLSPKSKQNQIFMFVGFLLLIITISIFVFLGFFKQKINVVEVNNQTNPLIFTDKNYFQDITSLNQEAIVQSVLSEVRNSNVKIGGVEAIYLTLDDKIVGLRSFFKLIKSNFIIPQAPLISDDFLIGVVKNNIKLEPNEQDSNLFFLLKSKSFIDSFQSMRNWEGKMFNDLQGFFGVNISAKNKDLLSKDFVDGIISNKNARILYDQNGQVVLMYVFVGENSIVISNSGGAIDEVILRLASSQISK